ncbi:MAG: alginate O-acetyltransferase complex protein AlgJ [Verrucomicrobiota bacterium]
MPNQDSIVPNEIPPVGGEEPRKPTHSLPRYSEPTPETHRKVTREEEAELALKHTIYTPGTRWLLIALFIVTITSVPAIQFAVELRSPRSSGGLATFDIYKALPAWAKIRTARSVADLWHLLPRAADLKAAEKSIETESVVSAWLLPRVQSLLTGKLRAGNEQVYLGRDAWLFYRPDVDYITGPPFLDPARLRHRVHADRVQPEPVKAIVDFRNQLSARGIDLIVMPAPMKPGVDANKLSPRADQTALLHNASFAEFKARLEKAGVRVFDPGPLLLKRKTAGSNAALYLESDTHWRPETMEFVAENLAAMIPPSTTAARAPVQLASREVSNLGDIARMLSLPPSQNLYRPEKITIHEVLSGNAIWRSSNDADILLLGDSFSNIFSLDALGWGESAGFAEHLSRALGRPLDCILRNSDAAYATREILSRDLARGRDRLAGKKLVVWEFAARELAFGDWKMIDMKLGQPPPARFFVPKPGEEIVVSGTVEAASTVPRAGTVPYRDHILALHLTDLTTQGRPLYAGSESLVYLWSMRDNVLTPAARLRRGDQVTLRLKPWADVAVQYEKINRSEVEDPAVQLEEPAWGEIVP